jgi:acetylornithine aminotransferase
MLRAEQLGKRMNDAFKQKLQHYAGLVEVRNKGLMIGIELSEPCSDLVAQALQQGLLINVAANKVIRLLPPLIINDDEAQLIVDKVSDLIIAH